MPRTKLPGGSVSVTFRAPRELQKRIALRARREQLSVGEFIRRALRREVEPTRKRRPE